MTEAQIKHMVDRFLGWRLPKPWHPDNGISYQRPNFAHAPADHDWPMGTNLFDADQATAMVRYMVEGMPVTALPDDHHPIVAAARAEADRFYAKECTFEKSSFVGGARFAINRLRE